VEGALPAVERLQRQLMARQEQAFHVSLYLTVRTHGPRQLAHAATQIEAAARSALTVLHPATFRQREARLATLPVGLDPLRRRRVLDSSSLTTLAPWWDGDLQQPGGLLCGVSRATGQPVLLDPFDDSRHQNANIGVYGHSGAGKTYLLSTLALGALDLGIQVLIVDPEHEYGGLADLLGGHHVRLALGSDVAINVLDLDQGVIDPDGLAPRIADAVDLCDVVCGGLDPAERAEVEGAVRQVVAHHPAPLLGDVAACLDATSRPARVLQRWVTGSLGRLFSRPTNVDLSAPLIVFGMRELRPELVSPVHFLLAQALWGRIRRRDRRRLLVVDELGLLFEDPTMRGFVVSLARRIRKYDGSLCFATQNPGDLLSSEAGAVVATNPAIQFFGSLRPGEAVRVQRHFELSDRQRAGLEQAARGEFLLAAGADRIPLRVTAPPWQAALLNHLRGSPAPARVSPRAEASVGDS
jgi:type IV secretory pathway VirB4 component